MIEQSCPTPTLPIAFPTTLGSYALAVVGTAAALTLTAAIQPWMGGTILPPAFAVVIGSALLGGRGPGLTALVLSSFGLKWFFLEPTHSVVAFNEVSLVRLGMFVGLGLPLVLLATKLGEARRRSLAHLESEKRSRLFLDAIVENIPDMVFVKEARDLRFVLFNRAAEQLLGWERTQLIGKTDHDLFPGRQSAFFRDHDRNALASSSVVDIPEEEINTKHGRRLLHTKKVTIRDVSGEAAYVLGISEDITERKAMEEERKRLTEEVEVAVHRKEEVLRVVSHDLRNPLNTIRLAAHEMVAEGSVPALAAVIDRAAGTMYELIEAVLEVARFEQGGIVLRKSRVSISGLVEDFLVDVQPRGATIDVEWGADPSDTVYVDRNRMRQVLTNLVTNAIQHSPPHECVRVGVERITGGHRFFVQDRGPGIAANDVPRVFDRYFTSSSGGTGMGLMIAKAIVESHKGTIGVDTEIGQGSRFWFTVPEDTAA